MSPHTRNPLSPMVRMHGSQPLNNRPLENPDGHAVITGPCGDTMEFWIRVAAGRLSDVHFTTTGCLASKACGSMTVLLAQGRAVKEARAIRQDNILRALNDLPPDHRHCALLASNTLRAAIDDFQEKQDPTTTKE